MVLPVTERYFVERGGEGRRVSLRLEYWTYLDHAGRVISADPDGYRFTGWSTLYRALLGAFDESRYHLGSEMVGFEPAPSGVVMRLGDGQSVEGDLLVCADGIASTARSILLPEATPRYSGYVAWRGVTDEAALSERARADLADAMLYQVLDHSHILAYAIPGDDLGTGGRQVNSVWYRNAPMGGAFESLMTDRWGERRTWTVPPGAIGTDHLDEMRTAAVEQLAPDPCRSGHRRRGDPDPGGGRPGEPAARIWPGLPDGGRRLRRPTPSRRRSGQGMRRRLGVARCHRRVL